jgi:dihydroflavonol-4-reductase
VLVTGAAGFLGANLVRVLLQKGEEVRALVRPGSDRSALDGLPVELVEGDVRDVGSVRRAVAGCRRVFHLAAHHRFWAAHPKEFYETNVRGTGFVMDACLAEGVERVVHTSTWRAIGRSSAPADESTPLASFQPASPYERTALHAEQIVLRAAERGLPVVLVNPTIAVGPWDGRPTPIGKLLIDFAAGRLPAFVDARVNLVHARDVAEGQWQAVERGRIGERYILGGENTTVASVLEELVALTGRPGLRVPIPYAAAWVLGAASTFLANWITRRPPLLPLEAVELARRPATFDCAKAVRELDLPRTPVRVALAEAVGWFQERGYLTATAGSTAWAQR